MTLRTLPAAKTFERPKNLQWDAPSDVLAKWCEAPLAAQADDDATISVFDVIGEDFWSGGGWTAKRMAGALRAIGDRDVKVQINSPGGDVFEGIAIYNLLREHPAKVNVDVMGWAASAASIIAMAGDTIRMGLGSFMMVHNTWGLVIGNRNDLREAADLFDGFDGALADIYEFRTGMKRADVAALMDAETFMGARDAVDKGFADEVADDLKADAADAKNSMDTGLVARRRTEAALAKAGFSRRERSDMIAALAGPTAQRDASRPAARDAGELAAMRQLLATLQGHQQ